MNRLLYAPLAITVMVIIGSAEAQSIDYRGFPQWSWGKQDSTEYYLYTPSDKQQSGPHPLVLFLHGCCGEDNRATLRNAVDPPVRMWHSFGENVQPTPLYILSPKTTEGWQQHFASLKKVIDELIARKKADPRRIYISSFSMGSAGAWQMIEAYPNYFAAAILMGMDFKGKDPANFKTIPVWAIRGDQDWWARHLGSQVKTIRELLIDNADSAEWHTGINPRLTNFEGMGHVVMWPAVHELNLSDWLLSKINDGNAYPAVMIQSPAYRKKVKEGEVVNVKVETNDPDGRIARAEVIVNERSLLTKAGPIDNFSFKAKKGDNTFSITVYDEKGKSATAEGQIHVDLPVVITTDQLPPSREGKYFSFTFAATGNGEVTWSAFPGKSLPEGLTLQPSGEFSGIPEQMGVYRFFVTARDYDGDSTTREINLKILKKSPSDVVLRDVKDYQGIPLPVTIARKGEKTHIRDDEEITISGIPPLLEGLTLIQTSLHDTTTIGEHYLKIHADKPVTVYVAYEKLNKPSSSTIPDWLRKFKREEGEIVAQYFYYDVYSKNFPAGTIALPHGHEKAIGVNTNYFVMVKKN